MGGRDVADATGLIGALLQRMGSYSEKALGRITEARAAINGDGYDSKQFFKHLLAAYDDTVDLFTAPWQFAASAPDAVITMPQGKTQASLQHPIAVQAPDQGEPESTDVVFTTDPTKKILKSTVMPAFADGGRGTLKIGLVGVSPSLPKGYYRGIIHIEGALLAELHVFIT
jgi:hypothetical protein